MWPKYTNVWARSAKVGSGTGCKSVADAGPACFLADELVIRGLFLLCFVVGGSIAPTRPNRLDIKLRSRSRIVFRTSSRGGERP